MRLQINGEALCILLYPGNVSEGIFNARQHRHAGLGPATYYSYSALFHPRLNVGIKEQSGNNGVTARDIC